VFDRKLAVLFLFVMAFFWFSDDEEIPIEEIKNITCTELFNEAYLEMLFEDIEIIPLSAYRQKSNNEKSCGYLFSMANKRYESSLTLAILGDATEEIFEASMMDFEDKKLLMDWGDKAYIYPLGLADEIAIFSKKTVIHGYIIEDNNESLILDKVLTKKFLYKILTHFNLP